MEYKNSSNEIAVAPNIDNQLDELRRQNETLKAQLMNTSLINELAKILHSCTDLENITQTVLLAINEILEFDRVILFGIDRVNFKLITRSWVGIEKINVSEFEIPLGFEGGEITDALFLNRHIIVEEPDKEYDFFYTHLESDGYLVMPIVNKISKRCHDVKSCNKTSCPAHGSYNPYCWSIAGSGQLLGASTEDEKRSGCAACSCFKVEGVLWMDRALNKKTISSDDITNLTAIVNLAGVVIENFRILKDLDTAYNDLQEKNDQLKVAQAKIRSDLEHARSIQQGLLPQDLNDTRDFAVGARYLSADAVGGDYYDIFQIAPDVYGIIVADVSGHGIASALIMSMAKVLLKTFAHNEVSPQKTLERINQTFLSEIKTDNFVTIFYAVLDTSTHILRYTSAGHCPILFLNKKTKSCTQIKADGLFMGVFPDMMLKETVRPYVPGNERFVLYTDGLTEARTIMNDMYGVDRLSKISIETLTLPVKETVEQILADQKSFCKDSLPEDDITLLVIDL